MARLQPELLTRVEGFADRVLELALALSNSGVHVRVVGQLIGCGTSVGANVFEADEAMSRADFCKCLGIAVKELNEVRFWIRLVARHGWVKAERLGDLEGECLQLKKVLSSMVARSKRANRKSVQREPV